MKLPQSGGYDTILTIMDHDCSKAIILIPCKELITTEGVAALILRHVFTRYRVPRKFISDRDTRFMSKVARKYCNKFKIQQNMSTVYHPRTDGQAERTNQEAKIYLHMYCNKRQNNWHLWLPLAECAHNHCPSTTTSQTPFSMIMGYTPKVEWPSAPSQVPLCRKNGTNRTSLQSSKSQPKKGSENDDDKKPWQYEVLPLSRK